VGVGKSEGVKTQLLPATHGVPESFLSKFGQNITGIVSGFDRIRFRGTLRLLFQPRAMERYLCSCGVLIKEFKHFAESVTAKVKAATYRIAAAAQRPVEYLSSPKLSKEAYARQIALQNGISQGLIALFSAKEPCYSYSVRGDRASQGIHLVIEPRMCTHFYHYFVHAGFGFMHVRVQSWFPFTVEVCLNGREWLARQMAQAGLGYEQADNCFLKLEDAVTAQALLDEQLHTNWAEVLNGLLNECHPLHSEISAPLGQGYYWSAVQSEYATDLIFKDAQSLAALYRQFLHHGIRSFASPDVLRFLGQRLPSRCQGQVTSTLKRRPEGVRIRHSVNANSIKLYDKQGQVLRVETTINNPKAFKVYRASEKDPEQRLQWRPLRLGVADLWRRAQVSQAANRRYLEALASTSGKSPLCQEALGVCRALVIKGRRYRALNPYNDQDGLLLEAINRGEFRLHGLRNRDLRTILYPKSSHPTLQRRHAAAITRRLALLRAHGILHKLSGTHRYQLTKAGQRILTALLAARHADVDQLTKMAA
jgi:hypothetical protein